MRFTALALLTLAFPGHSFARKPPDIIKLQGEVLISSSEAQIKVLQASIACIKQATTAESLRACNDNIWKSFAQIQKMQDSKYAELQVRIDREMKEHAAYEREQDRLYPFKNRGTGPNRAKPEPPESASAQPPAPAAKPNGAPAAAAPAVSTATTAPTAPAATPASAAKPNVAPAPAASATPVAPAAPAAPVAPAAKPSVAPAPAAAPAAKPSAAPAPAVPAKPAQQPAPLPPPATH